MHNLINAKQDIVHYNSTAMLIQRLKVGLLLEGAVSGPLYDRCVCPTLPSEKRGIRLEGKCTNSIQKLSQVLAFTS